MRFVKNFMTYLILLEGALWGFVGGQGFGASVLVKFSPLLYAATYLAGLLALILAVNGEDGFWE